MSWSSSHRVLRFPIFSKITFLVPHLPKICGTNLSENINLVPQIFQDVVLTGLNQLIWYHIEIHNVVLKNENRTIGEKSALYRY